MTTLILKEVFTMVILHDLVQQRCFCSPRILDNNLFHGSISLQEYVNIIFSSACLACNILATPLPREGGSKSQDGNLGWIISVWGNPHNNPLGDQR